MNMMHMVTLMVICYFITVTVLSIWRGHIDKKVGNLAFIVIDVVFFFFWTYSSYQRGRLTEGFMTLEQISPFMMTMMPLSLFMNDRMKKMVDSTIALLWIGMFVALIISPQSAYISSHRIEANLFYTSETACHLIVSLYGMWLIISGQIKCNAKTLGRACAFLYPVIGMGVILNFIFHRDYFGMDPYNGASIYMIDIFGGFWPTLIAYLAGVFLVLFIGLHVGQGYFKLVEGFHGADTKSKEAEVCELESENN